MRFRKFFDRLAKWLAIGAVLFPFALIAGRPAAAQQDANSAKITAPKAGDSLFGLVNIMGTASNPNMQRYILEFDLQDTQPEQWFPIAGPISQQVNGSVLAQWNTTTVPDGRYQVRLRVVLRDGTVLSDMVQNLRVSNKQPTPLPTVQSQATAAPAASPTVGPSPTPLVQQPPTNTPHPVLPTLVVSPAASPASNTALTSDSSADAPPIVTAFDSLQRSFCTGVYIALGAFVLFGAYSLVHARLRPVVRRLMNQSREE